MTDDTADRAVPTEDQAIEAVLTTGAGVDDRPHADVLPTVATGRR